MYHATPPGTAVEVYNAGIRTESSALTATPTATASDKTPVVIFRCDPAPRRCGCGRALKYHSSAADYVRADIPNNVADTAAGAVAAIHGLLPLQLRIREADPLDLPSGVSPGSVTLLIFKHKIRYAATAASASLTEAAVS